MLTNRTLPARLLLIAAALLTLLAVLLFVLYWRSAGADRRAYDGSRACVSPAAVGCRYHERATVMAVRHPGGRSQIVLRRADGAPLTFLDVRHRAVEPPDLGPGSTVTAEWWQGKLVRLIGRSGSKADAAGNPDDQSPALLLGVAAAAVAALLAALTSLVIERGRRRKARDSA